MKRIVLAGVLVAIAAAGCGGHGHGADFGAPSTVYPAPHAAMPHVGSHGGGVQTQPKLVAVTYDDDPWRPDDEAFLGGLGGTAFWSAAGAEYGVSAAVLTTSVHLAGSAPASITEGGIATTLAGYLDGSHPEFPVPDANTTYFLFYPEQTVIGDSTTGQSCLDFGAYHSFTSAAGGTVSYAVVPTCTYDHVSTLETLTVSASHEALEAATDPFGTGYWNATGDADGVWDLVAPGGELGDFCEFQPDQVDTVDGGGYAVQRTWSNAAAAASHDPCVPAPSGAFFAAAPELSDHASITVGIGFVVKTQAVKVGVGTTRTITLDLFSDGDTGGPFTISARDGASTFFAHAPVEVTATLDRTSGVNGEKVHLTIDHVKPGNSLYFGTGGSVMFVVAKKGSREFWWPVWVAN